MNPPALTLVDARVVTPEGVLDRGWVAIEAGRFAAVGSGTPPAAARTADLDGAWLLPGFVDLHMHGGGGHDATASPEDLDGAVAFHHTHGTTSTLVSLVTAPVPDLLTQLGWVAVRTGVTGAGARVLGSHLEGPFLSHVRCGAQNPEHLREPDPALLQELARAARGTLRVVTIAPELPGALELIAAARAAGIVAALGHSDATYAQGRAGIAAGASLATHLCNGMRPFHHREPGLIGASLTAGIACELINDGSHIHPAAATLIARTGAPLVLVTDAIDATGVGDGTFVLGGQQVQVRDGLARLTRTGSLAGSTLTMDEAVRRAVRDSGWSVAQAAAAAATHPARVLGLDSRLGAIAPGLLADAVVLDDDLRPAAVMSEGSWTRVTEGLLQLE
ncbi:MAG: N-acetylglucosamine-6-phosphate deacetylase [Jatrophihabitans sp.]|nr:MAG: N-acetylglucosamine-6-phosphate deacetylase [Jatrophihabitans sp.]